MSPPINPFILNLPNPDSFFPTLPLLEENPQREEKENNLSPHSIFYIENSDELLLNSRPYLPHTHFLIASARHENIFQPFCYFLLFTELKNQNHRYGIYFNPKSLTVLELKITLYAYPHHPVEVKILQEEKVIVEHLCFGHTNFNFFLLWEDCKQYPITLLFTFFNGETYETTFIFDNLILV